MLLVIRHVAAEHLGWFAQCLDQWSIAYRYLDTYREPVPTVPPSQVRALMVLGGPMSANDAVDHIQRELKLLERALKDELPVFGVCLGAQLIAKALGARVYRNPVPEIGWAPIRLTPEGRSDPLFELVRDGEPVFHWHEETFELPEQAIWLAYSDDCRHQAFRWGTATYGLQFHIEVTPEMIADWSSEAPQAASIDPDAHAMRMQALSAGLLSRWLRLAGFEAPVG